MAAGDVLFGIGGISTLASSDLLRSYDERSGLPAEEGQIGWIRDKFGGLRLFTFRKNISGSAFAAGDLTSRKMIDAADQTGTATTTVVDAAVTADECAGALAVVYDDAGGAGALPEGEASIVKSSVSGTATLEGALPWSVALANGDDVILLLPKLVDSASGDYNFEVCGVAMSATPDDDWGWFQFQGIHPAVKHTAAAVPAGEPVVAGAAAVADDGTDKANLWVGYQVYTHSADVVGLKSPVVMALIQAYV